MHILNLGWHNLLMIFSFCACITGLSLLIDTKSDKVNDLQESEQILFRMTFSYWMVYCVCFGLQKLGLPENEIVLMSINITAALSYFLTFACVLCLPLHRFSVKQVEQ
ncbi:hypothetical protein [Synechocystis sp. PCC 7509]|uniref:hypothetical protein n=1 Tax=Synechocystis sp. PCC 7509 TaxID=927677 RepID=UPI0002ABBCFF|nr:hypothetical protein [Synechocystis sp. PCC 7509]